MAERNPPTNCDAALSRDTNDAQSPWHAALRGNPEERWWLAGCDDNRNAINRALQNTKTPSGDYERNGLRFYDALTGLIPRHVVTLLAPSCVQNVVVTGMGFLIVGRDGYILERKPNFAFWVYPLHIQ